MAVGAFLDKIVRSMWRLMGPSDEDKAAGFELAVSTRQFARRTQKVVDDKLSFSATLLRAGEVEAANRLLREVEDEVLQEEAALLEKVAEVKVAQSLERKPVTRLRLARAMAVAMLGSTILASSAVGMAVVGLFRDDNAAEVGSPPGRDGAKASADRPRGLRHDLKRLNVAGVELEMTADELRRYRKLTSGGVTDEEGLESFLLEILPTPLAEQVAMALGIVSERLPEPIKQEVKEASVELNGERKKATEEKPKTDESPQPDDSPEPSPSDGNGDDQEEEEEGDSDDPPIIGGSAT